MIKKILSLTVIVVWILSVSNISFGTDNVIKVAKVALDLPIQIISGSTLLQATI